MPKLQCPFCDYTGSRASIEGHINGKTDEAHSGKIGADWREVIRGTVVEDDEESEPEEGGEGPTDDVAEEGGDRSLRYLLAATAIFALGSLAISQGNQTDQDDQDDQEGEQPDQVAEQNQPELPGVA